VKLIINADDLGYTPIINQAIFDLHEHRRITSASLLLNLPHSQDAVNGLRSYPSLRVGVHLNLTKACPLSPPEKVPSLVSPSGEFWSTQSFYARALTNRINSAEVETELRAQIERAQSHGILPAHLDSHSHWHILPHLRKLVIQLAKAYQIPSIRQTAPRRTLLPFNLWLAMVDRKVDPKSEFRTPDYLCSLHQWMRSDGKPADLLYNKVFGQLFALSNMTLELVTHPGKLHDPDFSPDTLQTNQRQWEYDFLRSSCFDEWLVLVDALIT
jgi:predicted glycoside hydrolase/deacetylase ChbG (UPF0249 family)